MNEYKVLGCNTEILHRRPREDLTEKLRCVSHAKTISKTKRYKGNILHVILFPDTVPFGVNFLPAFVDMLACVILDSAVFSLI